MLNKLLAPFGIAAVIILLWTLDAGAQTSTQMRPGDQGPITFDTTGNLTVNSAAGSNFVTGSSHLISTGAAPALTSCGGGSPAITGSDLAGTVTTGTTATGCIITFARAFAAAPTCVLSPASGVLASFSYTISTSAITVTQTSSSGNTITYICIGKQ